MDPDVAARLAQLEDQLRSGAARIRTLENRVDRFEEWAADARERLDAVRARRRSPAQQRLDDLESRLTALEDDTGPDQQAGAGNGIPPISR